MCQKAFHLALAAVTGFLLAIGLGFAGHRLASPAPAQDDPPPAEAGAPEDAGPKTDRPAPNPRFRARRKAIEAALATPADMRFIDTPLSDVAEWLQTTYDIPVFFDRRALDSVGILPPETSVTFEISGVSLREALDQLLGQLYLTSAIRHDVLLITTPEKAEDNLVRRIYDVSDLVTDRDPTGREVAECRCLWDAIVNAIQPQTWGENYGLGTLAELEYAGGVVFIVRQTEQVHEKIAELLADLRKANAPKPGAPHAPLLPLRQRQPYVRGGGFGGGMGGMGGW